MSTPDRALLAEKSAQVERHLERVATRLPAEGAGLAPGSDSTDAVILHLWQAVQLVLDLALSSCAQLGLGTPSSYADAFKRLASAGRLDPALADRLVLAAGFRNLVVHGYETVDLARVHKAATDGPRDLRAFIASLRDTLQ